MTNDVIAPMSSQRLKLNLQPHPGQPWMLHLKPGVTGNVVEADINYGDCLPKDVTLRVACSSGGQSLEFHLDGSSESDSVTVRGKPAQRATLHSGDLVALGNYAWILQVYASGQGVGLEPADPLPSASLQLRDVAVKTRLSIPALHIGAGQMVAIVGKSGAGKSTLIRELVEPRAGVGSVEIDGSARTGSDDPALRVVAYVPQTDVVHDDLTLEQQTRSLIELAGLDSSTRRARRALHVVGLRDLEGRFADQVSGGQLRRARLAAALGRRPGVLLLDEPDSGLDPDTAADIRRLLRTFSLLGCTIVMITHHRHGLAEFDRVLELDQGTITDDTSPLPLVEFRHEREEAEEDATTNASGRFQLPALLRREVCKHVNREFASWSFPSILSQFVGTRPRRLPEWLLGLILVPVMFGASVALTTPTDDSQQPYLVGFLCVLSVIWMAASNSYLSLTTEWKRIEFERSQGLIPYAYLVAKSTILALSVVIQVGLFSLALWVTRYQCIKSPIFYGDRKDAPSELAINIAGRWYEQADEHWLAAMIILLVVGLAASQLGLLISAVSKHRIQVAAAILPLIMIIQILFSAFVLLAPQSDGIPDSCYQGCWIAQQCQGARNCPSEALIYHAEAGMLCEDCGNEVEDRLHKESPAEWSGEALKTAIADVRELELSPDKREERLDYSTALPNRIGTLGSYLTLTRYADLALRPILGAPQTDEHMRRYGYASLQSNNTLILFGIALMLHLVTTVLLGAIPSLRSILRRLRRQTTSPATPRSTTALGMLVVMACFVSDETAQGQERHAPKPAADSSTDEPALRQLELPVSDGRYDARPILALRSHGEKVEESVWFPLTAQTRLGLVVLESQGVINQLTISDDVISFTYKGKVPTQLCPPRLLDVEKIGEHKQLVVLVHGLEGGLLTYRDLAPAFEERGWFPLRMIYPNDGDIEQPAVYLADQIKELSRRHQESRIVIVAHSLGGLVSWSALTKNELAFNVTDLFTMGTPFGGSSLAVFQSELELADVAVRLMNGDWTAIDIVQDGDGNAVDILKPQSKRRRALLRKFPPASIGIHLIAGSRGPISPKIRWAFKTSLKSLSERLSPEANSGSPTGGQPNRPTTAAEKLRVISASDEMVDGVGDGAVTIESATLVKNRAASTHIIETGHSGFLSKSKTQEEMLDWIIKQLQHRSK